MGELLLQITDYALILLALNGLVSIFIRKKYGVKTFTLFSAIFICFYLKSSLVKYITVLDSKEGGEFLAKILFLIVFWIGIAKICLIGKLIEDELEVSLDPRKSKVFWLICAATSVEILSSHTVIGEVLAYAVFSVCLIKSLFFLKKMVLTKEFLAKRKGNFIYLVLCISGIIGGFLSVGQDILFLLYSGASMDIPENITHYNFGTKIIEITAFLFSVKLIYDHFKYNNSKKSNVT